MAKKCDLEKLNVSLDVFSRECGVDAKGLAVELEERVLEEIKKLGDGMMEVSYDGSGGRLDIFQYFAVLPDKEQDASHLPLQLARKLDNRMDFHDELGLDRYRLTEEEMGVLGITLEEQENFRRVVLETVREVLRGALESVGRLDLGESWGVG